MYLFTNHESTCRKKKRIEGKGNKQVETLQPLNPSISWLNAYLQQTF